MLTIGVTPYSLLYVFGQWSGHSGLGAFFVFVIWILFMLYGLVLAFLAPWWPCKLASMVIAHCWGKEAGRTALNIFDAIDLLVNGVTFFVPALCFAFFATVFIFSGWVMELCNPFPNTWDGVVSFFQSDICCLRHGRCWADLARQMQSRMRLRRGEEGHLETLPSTGTGNVRSFRRKAVSGGARRRGTGRPSFCCSESYSGTARCESSCHVGRGRSSQAADNPSRARRRNACFRPSRFTPNTRPNLGGSGANAAGLCSSSACFRSTCLSLS